MSAAPPRLPPVVVGLGSRGPASSTYLNTGVDAHNSALLMTPAPGQFKPLIPRKVRVGVEVGLCVSVLTAIVTAFFPGDPFGTPAWMLYAWGAVVSLGILLAFVSTGISVGGYIRSGRHGRAVRAWVTMMEAAMHGHREQLLPIASVDHLPQWPDVQELIKALEQARTCILNAGDGHGGDFKEAELLHALGCLARYAEDINPNPGRKDAAHHAVSRFERAAIEHSATREVSL